MSDPKSVLFALGGASPSSSSSGLPNIPAVPATDNPALANILASVKLWIEKASDNGVTGFATKEELVRAGLIKTDANGNITSTVDLNLSTPPAPSGLTASGAMTTILVQWDDPSLAYKNHGYTEIWSAEANNFTEAQQVGQSPGMMFPHSVSEDSTRYYWIRFVSTAAIKGPFNSVNGTMGKTAKNPNYLLETLNGSITESQLYEDLNARIGLIDDPATGLVTKVGDLEIVYGDTVSAAASAAEAAQSASDAATAEAAAIIAKSGAEAAKDSAIVAKTNAATSASNASTSANQAATSATNAAGSASTAQTSATTAANSATSASNSAAAAATSSTNAATSATNAGNSATSASNSKTDAEAAYGNASNSATAAAASASTATTKASDAATSASSASTSANTAATKASDASTSATNAATSATNAAGSASSASTSATNAATSATAAGNSATAASTSASSASTSATNAGNSASASNTAKVAAESARDTASGSASAAATSASTASTKASEAATSASSASTSATKAATSATSAGVYATNAATSATSASGSATAAAQSLTQVQATANDYNGTVQTLARTVAGPDGATAQYTVKVQTGASGEKYVSGFGLSSESNSAGESTSKFIVVADEFAIAPVASDPSAADGSPFFHLTEPTIINGVTVPAGTYMKSAFIADASIVNAKIGSLSADKIATGILSSDRIGASTITSDKIAVGNLSAISADLGAMSAGSMTLNNDGFVRGGSSGYLTGAGFWMGFHSGQYKFHIGDPTTEYMAWTGSSLSIKGTLNAVTGTLGALTVAASGNIKMGQTAFDSGVGFWLGDHAGTVKFSIGNSAGNGIKWDGSELAVVGKITNNKTFSAGSNVVAQSNIECNLSQTASDGWKKQKQILIGRSGVITVSFDFKCSNNYSNQARIYKNGTPIGLLRTINTPNTYSTFSENISVSAGDLIQLFAYTPNAATLYFRRFQIKASELPETACVTDDYA